MSHIAPVAFESSWKKKEEKQTLKKAREEYLEKAKAQHERDEWRKEQARLRGEGTWMLDSVSDRITDESKEIEKLSKKEKKKKKQKKEKKHKKSKKESSDSEDSNDQWVEKPVASEKHPGIIKGPKLERDDWMLAPADLFSGVTREQLRAEKNKDKEEEKRKAALLDQPGMHERELNPYWKDGGTGLPEEAAKPAKVAPVIGDGGAMWLRKAYQRCKEQAQEEGRSLEAIAAERYGSLENLEAMIAEAEAAKAKRRPQFKRPTSRSPERPSRQRRSRSCSKERERDCRRSQSRDRDRKRRSCSRDRKRRSRSRDRSRSRSKDRNRRKSRSRSRDRSGSRSKDRNRRKSRSRSRDRSRSRSKDRNRRSRSTDRRRGRSRSRSRERSRTSSYSKESSRPSKLKGMFLKPGEMSDRSRDNQSSGAWRKKGAENSGVKTMFMKPGDSDRGSPQPQSSKSQAWKKPGRESSSSDSSSSSSESEAESEETSKPAVPDAPQPVVLLSEDEMNKLAAKVMRAQIMGNDALAKDLHEKLDAARKARESAPAEALAGAPGGSSRQEQEVLLTRTDRTGNVRPVFDAKHPKEPTRGRRKKQKVATHDNGGQRSRYFDDDDKYSLKDLVMREKMSTAEDQNSMFSRLAGKSFEKTDEDYDMDDVFMTRAAKKQSDSKQEERDKSMGILEHRKVSAAMEKCNRCMEKTPKHLIIAIGIKTYLCLPPHKSLSPGHCLIVPIHHTASATSLDEDVWTEIQVFRKGLTRMFQDRDEDVVFMETAMHLRSHPHMAIEVIPMPQEVGHMAPIYFKKAIQEAGEEWAQNKKLVDLSGRDVRRAVPKGFPYFSVDFGLQSGYAHVIEDEKTFPAWFGREIVGGMLESDPTLWRKPHKENFDDQRKKVLEFAGWWKQYDWTYKVKQQQKTDSDDSDEN